MKKFNSPLRLLPSVSQKKFSGLLLMMTMLMLSTGVSLGQNLTQTGFVSVITPKYMSSGTATRLPVMFRATVTGLTPSTVYRYSVQGATNSLANGGAIDFGTTSSGAGSPLLINEAGTAYT